MATGSQSHVWSDPKLEHPQLQEYESCEYRIQIQAIAIFLTFFGIQTNTYF